MMFFRSFRLIASAAAALVLGGCSAIDFYWPGMSGQMNLIAGARPISEVLETTNDPLLKERLLQVQQIRKFAIRELGLPDNPSYTRYTELGRPYVVWNVVATPELSLTPRQWCFAIVGCVSYRGYFNEADARAGDQVHLAAHPLPVEVDRGAASEQ
jgi:predicted aminopeptidase